MALFPCDVCRRRYPGIGNSAYIGWVAGGFNERSKYRLCPKHLAEFGDYVSAHMILIQRGDDLVDSDTTVSTTCEDCGERDGTVTWFGQVYAQKQPPEFYAGLFCPTCNEKLSIDPFHPEQELSRHNAQAR